MSALISSNHHFRSDPRPVMIPGLAALSCGDFILPNTELPPRPIPRLSLINPFDTNYHPDVFCGKSLRAECPHGMMHCFIISLVGHFEGLCGSCPLPVARIAQEALCCPRTAASAIRTLIDDGWLEASGATKGRALRLTEKSRRLIAIDRDASFSVM